MSLSLRPHGIISPGCYTGFPVNVPGANVPLGTKTELEQFPTGYGGCLQAVMVSPMLSGEQRENWQRKCSGASDASPIGGGRSLSERVEDSAQGTRHAWPRGSPAYQSLGAMENTAFLHPI